MTVPQNESKYLPQILQNVPIVNYVDFHSTKQAMFKLLDTNDHVVGFTKKIKVISSQLASTQVGDMVYLEYPITEYASTDFISEIDSNAIEMYLSYISSCNPKTKLYTPIDTIITSALYHSKVPSIVLGFDKLYVPDEIYITMSMNLVPMHIFHKIRDDVRTKTCYYNQGNVYINEEYIISNLF